MPRATAVALGLLLAACSGATPAPTYAPPPVSMSPAATAAPVAPGTPSSEDAEPEDAPAPQSRTAALRAHDLRARRGNAGYIPPPRTKSAACAARGALPDASCTPGAVMTDDLAVVCHESTTHRRLVPAELRHEVLASYGYPPHPIEPLEVDHLIPLELGGDNAIENLWPEPEGPGDGFREKDRVEHYLHRQVCRGAISLRDAQRVIATDWRSVLGEIAAGRVGER